MMRKHEKVSLLKEGELRFVSNRACDQFFPSSSPARQNERLAQWLGDNGVWMSDRSGWGVPPHPLGR